MLQKQNVQRVRQRCINQMKQLLPHLKKRWKQTNDHNGAYYRQTMEL